MESLKRLKLKIKALWLGQIVGMKILIKLIKQPSKIKINRTPDENKTYWFKVGHRLGRIAIKNGY